jgi:DivIVA domain-containing protein
MQDGQTSDPSDRRTAPAELRRVEFGRVMRGYDPEQVESWVSRAQQSYEELWRERVNLVVLVSDLQTELDQYSGERQLIQDALVAAQRLARNTEADALLKSEALESEAQARADEILRVAQENAERLLSDAVEEAKTRHRDAEAQRETTNAELQRLEELRREMSAGYRAFLLAALELLEGHEWHSQAAGEGSAPETSANGGSAATEALQDSDTAAHTGRFLTRRDRSAGRSGE